MEDCYWSLTITSHRMTKQLNTMTNKRSPYHILFIFLLQYKRNLYFYDTLYKHWFIHQTRGLIEHDRRETAIIAGKTFLNATFLLWSNYLLSCITKWVISKLNPPFARSGVGSIAFEHTVLVRNTSV